MAVKRKKGSGIAKYREVEIGILGEIEAGRFSVGDKIWSESEMIRRFNVSASTVQKAVNKLVHQGVLYREQGRGTFLARDLSAQRTKRLALVLPPHTQVSHNEFLGPIIDGIHAGSSSGECRIILASDDESMERISTQDNLDGVMIAVMSEQESSRLVHEFFTSIPVVFVSSHPQSEDFPYVIVANEVGAYQATTHLLRLGHTRIAFVSGGADKSYKNERREGYARAMVETGVDVDPEVIIHAESWAEAGGEDAANRIAAMRPMPTAVFAVSDGMALGLLRRFEQLRIRVPVDIAVVGFNNLPMCQYVRPSLTTVDANLFDMGRQATVLLERLANGEEVADSHIHVPARLIVRDSCGAYLADLPQAE